MKCCPLGPPFTKGESLKIEVEEFLSLAERTNNICAFDIEATGLKGDYNSILCVSIRTIGGKPTTFSVKKPGNDREVVRDAIAYLNTFSCWISYYGKGFDVPMLNTRALKWNLMPLKKIPHIDMYYTLKYNLNTSRRSQAHLLEWLRINDRGSSSVDQASEQVHKLTVSADEWNRVLECPERVMPTMVKRCESDTLGLQALYLRTKHLIKDIKR